VDVGRFVVEAHLKKGRPVAELAAAHVELNLPEGQP
jgi:(2Fe-2S) ferredoxin